MISFYINVILYLCFFLYMCYVVDVNYSIIYIMDLAYIFYILIVWMHSSVTLAWLAISHSNQHRCQASFAVMGNILITMGNLHV